MSAVSAPLTSPSRLWFASAGNSNPQVVVGAGERMLDYALSTFTKCWENLMLHSGSDLYGRKGHASRRHHLV